jgi:glycosyltransferase involved in cell wall biosynthesis
VNGFIFPLQIIQLRITLGKCVKIIVLHRAEKPFSGIKKWLQRLADKCVNGYLFTSAEFGKEWVQKGIIINPDKIHEVIQASSHFSFQQRAMARIESGINGSPIFLWVGRLDTNKDPITVIKAFIKFLKKQPGAKLYMVYQSDELLPQVVELIQANPSASASIQLVGKIQHEKLQAWYNSADFIISSSHYEGSGIAVSEAMSCGCIPILSNIISFRKMTGPGVCGLLYEPGNDKALLDALIQSMNFDIDTEQKKTLDQFQNELSFGAIAKKINLILAD